MDPTPIATTPSLHDVAYALLVEWVDLPLMLAIVLICRTLRPVWVPARMESATFRLVPLGLAAIFAALIESQTNEWNLNVFIRRTLAAGAAAPYFYDVVPMLIDKARKRYLGPDAD